mgnify:CR=1 FL=1
MNKNYDYNQTFKIEQLNELSKGTTARLIGYLTKQNIDIKNSPNNLYKNETNQNPKANYFIIGIIIEFWNMYRVSN